MLFFGFFIIPEINLKMYHVTCKTEIIKIETNSSQSEIFLGIFVIVWEWLIMISRQNMFL